MKTYTSKLFENYSIPPEIIKKLAPLAEKRNTPLLKALIFDYSLIIISIYTCLSVSWYLYPITLIAIGSTQRALTNLLHEATHATLAKSKLLNYLGGTVFSGHLVFHMFIPYRASHIQNHHPKLGDPELDPDYKFHIQCGLYNYQNESSTVFIVKNVLLTLIGFRSWNYINYIIRDRILYSGERKGRHGHALMGFRAERLTLISMWSLISLITLYHGVFIYLIVFWLIPLFTTAVAIGWIIELSEHYPLPQSETSSLLLTRNRHGWLLERFIFGRHNDNYHLVHHLRPSIPFYNMRKAHCILLEDPRYRAWDGIWGGIITRTRDGEESVLSYVKAYKDWLVTFPQKVGQSYAVEMLNARTTTLACNNILSNADEVHIQV